MVENRTAIATNMNGEAVVVSDVSQSDSGGLRRSRVLAVWKVLTGSWERRAGGDGVVRPN